MHDVDVDNDVHDDDILNAIPVMVDQYQSPLLTSLKPCPGISHHPLFITPTAAYSGIHTRMYTQTHPYTVRTYTHTLPLEYPTTLETSH